MFIVNLQNEGLGFLACVWLEISTLFETTQHLIMQEGTSNINTSCIDIVKVHFGFFI